MPSPFPGMDPYLEASAGWTEVHQRLITTLSTELSRLLPPQYLALMGERIDADALLRDRGLRL